MTTLSAYIAEDLEHRIRSGSELPCKLTLFELSQQYGVSMTPIRIAIDDLIDRKLLLKQENGRLLVNPRKWNRSRGSKALVRRDLPLDKILANDIVRRSLQNDSSFLREEAEAKRHGIGRTMLRHAFSNLAGRGLLEHVPRRGWRIRPFREEEMFAYLDVREVLELKALELAKPRLDRVKLEELLAANQLGDSENPPRIDNRLHQYFVDNSGNRYIKDFFATHGGYYSSLFELASVGESFVDEMIEQHREILTHVLAGRWDKARLSLAHHIHPPNHLVRRMIALIEKNGTSQKSEGVDFINAEAPVLVEV